MNHDTPVSPPTFSVGELYSSSGQEFTTSNLIVAVKHAASFAMWSGKTYAVKCGREQLLSVSPSTIDWRRVNAHHMLAVKAMAHDLVDNVDEVIPTTEMEGIKP